MYGRPGVGKSTFAKKLAVDWSRGEKKILRKFQVLLLIKLRNVCNIQDITSMLQEAELLSIDDPTVFNKLYEYILQNQQKVLLVLDGYDEYSSEKSSAVYEIWKGVRLPDCTVLVTTRPTKEEELRAPSHALFEINGFGSEEQIKKFALKFLHHEEDIDEFTNFLSKRGLWGLAKIPLLLLMLCLAWKDKENPELLTSRADLYKSFFDTLFDHVAAKNPEQTFTSVDEHKEDLSKLGKLAFDALLEDCLYFKLSKLPEDIRALIEKFMSVGFFQISNLSSSRRREQGVFFLHKSIQEFLSAWFIVQELTSAKEGEFTCLSQIDSFAKVKKMVEVLKFALELSSDAACLAVLSHLMTFLGTFEKVKTMVEILKFVCEFSSEATSAVLSHLRVIGEKEDLIECSFTETPSVKDLSEDQRKFRIISLHCLLCCPASGRQDIFPGFVHCVNSVFVIDEDQLPLVAREHALKFSDLPEPSHLFFNIRVLIRRLRVHGGVLSVLRDLETVLVTCYGDTTAEVEKYNDLVVDDFFLKKGGGQMILYLTRINKKRCIELLRALTSAPECPPQKPFDHVQNRRNSNETESTSDRTQKHSLSFVREIKLEFPTGEELTVVTSALPFVNGPRVIDISTGLKSCYAQLMERLVSRIPFTNNLKKLHLSRIYLTAKSATDIFRQLHQAHNLHELDLSCNNIHITVGDLAENLHYLPQLTLLDLSGVHMGDKECRLLAESLKFVRKLQVLNLSFNQLGQGITELAKHLFNVPHLTELDLRHTQMGEKEVTGVARSLQSISKLKKLVLSRNPLGQGITELATHLPSVPHLTELNLWDTQMGEKEVTAVARSLQGISKLKKLVLSRNPLGQVITELATHLPSVPHLTELDLAKTQMGEKEVTTVARSLQSISKLKKLVLSFNPLGQGITELVTHLPSVPYLTKLDLMGTQMGEKEVTAVARALKDLPNLKRLNLSSNPLGRGVSELIQHLSSIPQLRNLELGDVKMTKKEASELCAALEGKEIDLLTDYHVSFLLSLYFVFTLCIFYLLILEKLPVSLF